MNAASDYQTVLERTLGIPFSAGNSIRVLNNGDEIFPAMIDAIRNAKQSIDFLTFVYWSGNIADRIAKELSKKAEEGVPVRVILDSFGAAFMPRKLTRLMERSGVHIEWFRPIPKWKLWQTDNRTHRKVLICDDRVAFTGGVGIAEEWEGDARNPGEWRETHFRVEGPALFGLYAAFMENWIETGQELECRPGTVSIEPGNGDRAGAARVQVVRTSASVRWSDIVMLYQTLISLAQKNIRITTAYFNPNQTILNLLIKAAQRGVQVDILIPGSHIDKRVANIAGGDCFEALMDAGVNLWFYQKTMLHSKIITIDGCISCVGSANFNHRSMLKDDEVNMVVIDSDLADTLNNDFRHDLQYAEKVRDERWKNRSTWRKGLEGITRLFKQQI